MEKILVLLLVIAVMVIILLLVRNERKRRWFAGFFAIIWMIPSMGTDLRTLIDFITLGAMCLFAFWWAELNFRKK